MEQQSGAMQITLPEEMHALIRQDFRCTERGVLKIKGIGRKRLYSLEGSGEPMDPVLP